MGLLFGINKAICPQIFGSRGIWSFNHSVSKCKSFLTVCLICETLRGPDHDAVSKGHNRCLSKLSTSQVYFASSVFQCPFLQHVTRPNSRLSWSPAHRILIVFDSIETLLEIFVFYYLWSIFGTVTGMFTDWPPLATVHQFFKPSYFVSVCTFIFFALWMTIFAILLTTRT